MSPQNTEQSAPGVSVRVSEREAKCLAVLADSYSEDFGYLRFSTIQAETGLDRSQVRRSVRTLARKGLAKFSNGLWTDSGEMAGSGYACTDAGLALHEAHSPSEPSS